MSDRMEAPVTPMPTPMSAWLQQAWLARYLDRQLDGDETAWFEAYVLDKPELLAMIDADNRLRDALAAEPRAALGDAPNGQENRKYGTASLAAVATSVENGSDDKRVVQFPKRGPLQSWLAVAAALVLGLGIGGIGMRSLEPSQSASVIASPTRIVYDTMRGEVTPPRVEHADSTSPYVLIEVAVPPGADHVAFVIGDSAAVSVSVSPDGFASALIPNARLGNSMSLRVIYNLNGRSINRILEPLSR